MILTEEQKKFVNYSGKNSIILSATAGSGKTRCSVERLKYLLSKGIKPERIIFFSYTNAAVDELKERIGNESIKITTIHSFCLGLLKRLKIDKKTATFHDFLAWFHKKNYPTAIEGETEEELNIKINDFEEFMSDLYDESEYLSSKISSYKLEKSDGIETSKEPEYYNEYQEFLTETGCMDFSDILIETKETLKDNRYLRMVKDKYEYIFVDEYQDTSTIQMDILLKLNAKYYYIIGDRNQGIFSYTGVSCDKIEEMLKKRRTTEEMSLTVNFRSDVSIINNSNKYSSLTAIPNSTEQGKVDKRLIYMDDVEYLTKNNEEVVILVRTNAVIREMEFELLKRRCPVRYFNYIKPEEINLFKKGEAIERTKNKFEALKVYFNDDADNIIKFIEQNNNQKSFVTTIHKSKGREFDICTVVNSLSPDIIEENQLENRMSKELLKYYSFNPALIEDAEMKNIHYVAITRPKHELHFMLYILKKQKKVKSNA